VAELAVALEEFASAPGAAARIRAVLDTPRTELEPVHAGLSADPDAETKTAASIDTTQRVQRRGLPLAERWPSLLAIGAGIAGLVALAFVTKGPAPSQPPPSPSPIAAAALPAAPSAPPEPPSSVPAPSPSKLAPARGAPARRASTSPTPPATTAPPKPSTPVLVPKTTEF
jgi:hypothetical protein